MVADCPSDSGPAESAFVAIPFASVTADADPWTAIPDPAACQMIVWPTAVVPFTSASAGPVQENVVPAASENGDVSERSVGGVPPVKCASSLEPLESDAVTTDESLLVATTFMLARPSPVAITWQTGRPQASLAVPLVRE